MKNDLTPNFQPPTSYAGFPCSLFREPCSENWYVDQRRTGWDAMFTFSGKERDEETGYGYFGARYYDSDISIWLSVDPMADKYPSLRPYVYCANNPVKLVDPDGMLDYEVNGKTKTINDGGNNLKISVSKAQYRRLERKFNRNNGGYESYRDKMSVKKGMPTDIIVNGQTYVVPANGNGDAFTPCTAFQMPGADKIFDNATNQHQAKLMKYHRQYGIIR